MGLLIISLPFLHAFGFLGLSLPFITCNLILLYLLLKNKLNFKFHFNKLDFLLILFLMFGIAPIFVYGFYQKNFNHVGMWIATLSMFYFGTKCIVTNSKFTLYQLKKYFFISLCITTFGVIIDFILANYNGYYLSDLLPYQMGQMEPTKNFSDTLFRPRGFAAEPGFSAMVYELLIPLGILYCIDNPKCLILLPMILIGYFILTSAASLGALFVTSSIFIMLSRRKLYAIGLLVIILTVFSENIIYYLVQTVGPKLTLLLEGESLRGKLFYTLLPIFFDNPLGVGFGTISHFFYDSGQFGDQRLIGAGALNLYLEIALAGGILSLVTFFIFLCSVLFARENRSDHLELAALRFSMTWLLLHHIFLTEYYFPMLWICLALLRTFNIIELRTSKLNKVFRQ